MTVFQVVEFTLEFPSPLGGSQFSKVSMKYVEKCIEMTLDSFHPLWAGLSFQRRVQTSHH